VKHGAWMGYCMSNDSAASLLTLVVKIDDLLFLRLGVTIATAKRL